MTKKTSHSQYTYFSINALNVAKVQNGATEITLHAEDRYHRPRYALERGFITGLLKILERYLRKRPHKNKDSRYNIARSIVYMSPSVKAWSQYMPGGFATYYVHNPERLWHHDNKKLDYITRNMFRHSIDGQAIRSRAYAMTWYIDEHTKRKKHELVWLSVACGTAQPVFDAAKALHTKVGTFVLTDVDVGALAFADRLADTYGLSDKNYRLVEADIVKDENFQTVTGLSSGADVIDVMGLFEYLDDDTAVKVLTRLHNMMKRGSVLVFTNMRPEHPHLALHQRGLSWPGVIQRTREQVYELLERADVPLTSVTTMLPDDDVYAVYGVKR